MLHPHATLGDERQALLPTPRRRGVGVLSLVVIGLFWVSGGIYGNEELISAAPPLMVIAWTLGCALLFALPNALMTAELATAFPATGGQVVWVESACGSIIGAQNGFWEFNPSKCTLRSDFPLPLEEVLWLFHHVLKTALYQLKAFELVDSNTGAGAPTDAFRDQISVALVAASAFGLWALTISPDDSVKCIGLVAAFFAPIWLIIWQVGYQFVLRHADRLTWGWFAPGITTVLIDCLGQQQSVWRFPDAFLSGIGVGYLKLDIFLVYMVSTFAVTGTGGVILAATEELTARRAALGMPEPTSLLEVWDYIRSRRLDITPASTSSS